MNKTTLIFILFAFNLNSFSQQDSINSLNIDSYNKKYCIWISPLHSTHVYGLYLNIWPNERIYEKSIYGAELNFSPEGLVIAPLSSLFYTFSETLHYPLSENIKELNFSEFKKIYGLQLSLYEDKPRIINGLNISVSSNTNSITKGISISPVVNKHYLNKGLTVGLIGNYDLKCNGVQIGISNSCKELKGFQFGFWNRNQKRSLPIINWSFKNDSLGSLLVNRPETAQMINSKYNNDSQKYVEKYEELNQYATIFNAVGLSCSFIWLVNEAFNSDFHSGSNEDRIWKYFLIGTSISFTSTGVILDNKATIQLRKGLIEYYKK